MTSELQRQIATDIQNTAMSMLEFAATRQVNGKPLICVFNDDATMGQRDDGIFLSGFELYYHAEAENAPRRPRVGARITIDGRMGTVTRTSDTLGILMEIRGQWHEA